jgi:proteasome lid subunit RPN8/RPN11
VENILAYDGHNGAIQIPLALWARAIFQLRSSCARKRESGAFLLGPKNGGSTRVTAFVRYDDLDPDAYQSGAIAFHAAGYAALWRHCGERQLRVLADVHTHPGASVQQSWIDQKNPMLPTVGHIALIVPHFARTPWWSLKDVGVYEYLGSFTWRNHPSSVAPRRVGLTLW